MSDNEQQEEAHEHVEDLGIDESRTVRATPELSDAQADRLYHAVVWPANSPKDVDIYDTHRNYVWPDPEYGNDPDLHDGNPIMRYLPHLLGVVILALVWRRSR